jgi:hypothetical protein
MIHLDPTLTAPRPVPASAPADAPARALIEAQLAMLIRLAQIGMEIAEAVGRDAAAATPGAPDTAARRDPGLVFARVARAVRMTIALQSRLAKDLAALDRADDMAQAARKTRRRMRLSRLVEDAARAQVAAANPDGDEDAVEDEIEQLASAAYERLTDAEDGDFLGRPFDEVVAGICADLGLPPDWTARLHAAVAAPPDGSGDAPRAPRPELTAARPPDPDPPPPIASPHPHHVLPHRQQRQKRQFQVLPGEGDADDGDGEADGQHDVVQGQPPAGQDEPQYVEDQAHRACLPLGDDAAEGPVVEAGDAEGGRRPGQADDGDRQDHSGQDP